MRPACESVRSAVTRAKPDIGSEGGTHPIAAASRTDAALALFAAAAAAAAAEWTLLSGITTVRDVGGRNDVEMVVRNDLDR